MHHFVEGIMVMINSVINREFLSVTANMLPQKVKDGFRKEIRSKPRECKRKFKCNIIRIKNQDSD